MERQFTRQAENALKLATTIAKSCGHGYIGTEHLLAGLLKEPEGTAGKVLQEFNVEEEKLRELISSLVTPVQAILRQQKQKIPSTAREQEGSLNRRRKMLRVWNVFVEQSTCCFRF